MVKIFLPYLFVAVASCQPLFGQPGAPLTVGFTDDSEIVLLQQLTPQHVEFTVKGCNQFTVWASVDDGTSVRETKIGWGVNDQGNLQSDIPVDALRAEAPGCEPKDFETDVEQPVLFRLKVSCDQDGRTASSQPRSVRYRPGEVVGSISDTQLIFPLAQAGSYALVGPNGTQFVDANGQPLWSLGGNLASSPDLLIKQVEGRAYVLRDGPGIEVDLSAYGGKSDELVLGSTVLPAAFNTFGGGMPYSILGLPNDLVYVGGSDVIISSSRLFIPDSGWETVLPTIDERAFTFVTVVDPTQPNGGLPGTLHAAFFQEYPLSGVVSFAGVPALFLHSVNSPNKVRVRGLDGTLLTEITLSGTGALSNFEVSGDGTQWAYVKGIEIFVQSPGTPAQALPVSFSPGNSSSGQLGSPSSSQLVGTASGYYDVQLVWLSTGDLIVVGPGGKVVELHGRDGGARRIHLVSNASSVAVPGPVLKVVPSAHGGFGILTATGVQLADATGNIFSGADPLPAACRANLRPSNFVAIGPDTLLLATATSLIRFTVPWVEVSPPSGRQAAVP